MLMVTKSSRPAGIRSCPGPSLPSGNQPELADRRWLPGPAALGRVQSRVAAGHREVHVSRRAVAEGTSYNPRAAAVPARPLFHWEGLAAWSAYSRAAGD